MPRLSYAAVEDVLKDVIAASPVQRAAQAANKLGQRMQQTIAGLKVNLNVAMRKPKWGSFGGQPGGPVLCCMPLPSRLVRDEHAGPSLLPRVSCMRMHARQVLH